MSGPTEAEVEAVLPRFTGPIEQVPPAFSALKVEGKRAYDLARAGKAVELKARQVTIHGTSRRLVCGAWPPEECVTLSATVSKGTYIRSLARDIAHGARHGRPCHHAQADEGRPFTLEQAISLDFLNDAAKARTLDGAVLPLEAGLDDIPALPVTPEQAQLLRHGQQLFGIPAMPGLHLATSGDNAGRAGRGFG